MVVRLIIFLAVWVGLSMIPYFIYRSRLSKALKIEHPFYRWQVLKYSLFEINLILFPFIFISVNRKIKKLKEQWRAEDNAQRVAPKFSSSGEPMHMLNFEEQDIVLGKKLINAKHAKSKCIAVWGTETLDEVKVFEYTYSWGKKKHGKDLHGEAYFLDQCPKCKLKTYETKDKKTNSNGRISRTVYRKKCSKCSWEDFETEEMNWLDWGIDDNSTSGGSDYFQKEFDKRYEKKSSSLSLRKKSRSSSSASSSRKKKGSSWGGGSSRGGGSSSKW
jgi:uncharacterized protein